MILAKNRYGLPAWGGTYNMLIRASLIERLVVDAGILDASHKAVVAIMQVLFHVQGGYYK